MVGFEGTSINSQFFKDVSISFSIIALGSVAVGASVGLISAWLLRRLKNIQLSPTFEFALLVVFAYLSYVLAEALEFSGIVSVFVLSIVMAHYHWFPYYYYFPILNLFFFQETHWKENQNFFLCRFWVCLFSLFHFSFFLLLHSGIGYLCETSCFIALGLCMFNRENALKKSSWNIMYCLCALVCIFFLNNKENNSKSIHFSSSFFSI